MACNGGNMVVSGLPSRHSSLQLRKSIKRETQPPKLHQKKPQQRRRQQPRKDQETEKKMEKPEARVVRIYVRDPHATESSSDEGEEISEVEANRKSTLLEVQIPYTINLHSSSLEISHQKQEKDGQKNLSEMLANQSPLADGIKDQSLQENSKIHGKNNNGCSSSLFTNSSSVKALDFDVIKNDSSSATRRSYLCDVPGPIPSLSVMERWVQEEGDDFFFRIFEDVPDVEV